MRLTHSVIITRDVAVLRRFYREVLGAEPSSEKPDYVEFTTEGAALGLYDLRTHERYAPRSAAAAANRTVMIEFEVASADAEHARLRGLGVEVVMPPTTFPWGTRALYCRDPDGNLLNFYERTRSRGPGR